ncbi:MAG: response regulator transcription factor [Alphaproteobacteria bacterium]|nr:response regulator transcription factor [Alphaproteobacteria bacterium]
MPSMDERILLVDGDAQLRQILSEQLLRQEDFREVVEAASGAEAVEKGKAGPFHAILIDAVLPDMGGGEAAGRLREAGIHVPVILLATQDNESAAIAAVSAGANDYVIRPFRLSVLLARIRAHLRQHERDVGSALSIAHYRFQPNAKTLTDGERKIRLTEKEVAILVHLLKAGDAVVSRDRLLHEVWGYGDEISTHTLETHIYRLRRKLEENPSDAKILITEPGGYRLRA